MKTPDNLFLQMRDDVFIHWDWLRRGKTAACQFLSQYVRSLYAELALSHLTPQRIKDADDAGGTWKPCFSKQGCRAGLLDLQPGEGIPPSIYENSIGVALVVGVKPHLSSMLSNIIHSEKLPYSRDLKPGDTCCMFLGQNDTRHFVAKHKTARVFLVLFQNDTNDEDSHYAYPWTSRQQKNRLYDRLPVH
jgi:hypothetical protein